MKPSQVVGFIICSLALVLTIPTGIQAAVGHFTEVEGRVDLLRGGKPPTIEVKVQDGVEKGDVVRTKSLSRAQIKFVDDTTLTISPESRVAIEEYLYDSKTGRRQAVLQIFRGIVLTLVSKIIKTEEPNFVIKTHTTVMGVRGTKTYTVLNPISTDIYNERGLVRVKNALAEIPGSVDLGDMAYTRVGADLPPTIPMPITKEDLAQIKARLLTGPNGPSSSGVQGDANGNRLFDLVSTDLNLVTVTGPALWMAAPGQMASAGSTSTSTPGSAPSPTPGPTPTPTPTPTPPPVSLGPPYGNAYGYIRNLSINAPPVGPGQGLQRGVGK